MFVDKGMHTAELVRVSWMHGQQLSRFVRRVLIGKTHENH